MTASNNTAANLPKGYLCIVLHAHLPYVRHPEINYMMEENWFYEAVTETYIPLLAYLNNLADDGIPFRMTMSLTPTLCSMLGNELLQDRYVDHIDRLIELAGKEIKRTRHNRVTNRAARMYLERFSLCKHIFEDVYSRDIITGFKNLQDAGILEIITCAATHGYLPNMQSNHNAVRAQIEVAVRSYAGFFGCQPRGIWLPECGYYRGLESILDKCGIRHLFMETHGLLNADPPPPAGVLAPVKCKEAPVAAFARDAESSRSVWSADEGYPGDPHYREFHKDIGFDLDMRYVAPYIDPAGIRINTGIKYHRVTDKRNPEKQLYDREKALSRAVVHAADFMHRRVNQINGITQPADGKPPVVVAPYDAELFGHWWFEGPEWLNYLIRKCALEQDTLELITPSEYLDRHPATHACSPAFSSWGDGGYSHMWLNETNEWIYPHLHRLEDRMVECAREFRHTGDRLEIRTLNQMARELLLAQSSDWAFIMKTGTTVEYATRRVKEHIASFLKLYDQLKERRIDEGFTALLESHNDIFPEIDFRVYC
jgi:1,4-alpha-glucan branching enzyme